MCYKIFCKEPFMLKYCSNKIQKMCDKAVDSHHITLKYFPNWFVTNKMLRKLDISIFSNVDIFFHDVYSNITSFLSYDMGFNTINVNNVNLVIQKLLLMLDLWPSIIDLNNANHVKK